MNALTLWIEDDEKNFIASNAQTWREWWCRFNLSLQEDIYFKKLPSPSHYACRPIVLRHKAITFT